MERFGQLPSAKSLLWKRGEVLVLDEDKLTVRIPLENETVGALRDVRLRVHLGGEKGSYSPCVFLTEEGEMVDYALERGAISPLRFPVTVKAEKGAPYVELCLVAGRGEELTLMSVETDAPTVSVPLLGGVELIQMEPQHKQMMGYLFVTPEGRVVVFDGGAEADAHALAEQILALGGHVDAWFVTHFHSDHVAAIVGALERYDLTVDLFGYDFRGAKAPDYVGDGGKKWVGLLENTLETYRGQKVKEIVTTRKGDRYEIGSVTVKVLNDAHFSNNEDPVNNSSVVFKVETPGESVLITGDLGARLARTYLRDEDFLREIRTCRVIQMAHHGQDAAEEDFYDAIDDIRVCLYAAAQWLFDNDRHGAGFNVGPYLSLQTRAWMRKREVPEIYTSIDGRLILR